MDTERKLVDRLQFEPTHLHRGLLNSTGENNCFLNVTIQALWHLGPFRHELKKQIEITQQKNAKSSSGSDSNNSAAMTTVESEKSTSEDQETNNSNQQDPLIQAMCNMFIQYEFTDQGVLPPTELRDSLGKLSEKFQLGRIADANEVFDYILERIHTESSSQCPQKGKCLAHEVFGGTMMEQTVCMKCDANSEPIVRTDFLLNFQAAELIYESKSKMMNDKNSKELFSNSTDFGKLLQKCMSVAMRSCPSLDDTKVRYKCDGKAKVQFHSLETPLALALSVGWTNSTEEAETLRDFFSIVSYTVNYSDIFPKYGTSQDNNSGPSYIFRGLVCYYGLHYVSIFQNSEPNEVSFLLFDDQRVRSLGNWHAVKEECIKAHYQPVLLLYELEKAPLNVSKIPSRDSRDSMGNESTISKDSANNTNHHHLISREPFYIHSNREPLVRENSHGNKETNGISSPFQNPGNVGRDYSNHSHNNNNYGQNEADSSNASVSTSKRRILVRREADTGHSPVPPHNNNYQQNQKPISSYPTHQRPSINSDTRLLSNNNQSPIGYFDEPDEPELSTDVKVKLSLAQVENKLNQNPQLTLNVPSRDRTRSGDERIRTPSRGHLLRSAITGNVDNSAMGSNNIESPVPKHMLGVNKTFSNEYPNISTQYSSQDYDHMRSELVRSDSMGEQQFQQYTQSRDSKYAQANNNNINNNNYNNNIKSNQISVETRPSNDKRVNYGKESDEMTINTQNNRKSGNFTGRVNHGQVALPTYYHNGDESPKLQPPSRNNSLSSKSREYISDEMSVTSSARNKSYMPNQQQQQSINSNNNLYNRPLPHLKTQEATTPQNMSSINHNNPQTTPIDNRDFKQNFSNNNNNINNMNMGNNTPRNRTTPTSSSGSVVPMSSNKNSNVTSSQSVVGSGGTTPRYSIRRNVVPGSNNNNNNINNVSPQVKNAPVSTPTSSRSLQNPNQTASNSQQLYSQQLQESDYGMIIIDWIRQPNRYTVSVPFAIIKGEKKIGL
eukprot:gene12103-16196_t